MEPKANVLVVEDENIVAVDIMDRLRGLGYEISAHVTSGEAAIEKAGELRPDLVLMDIMLKGQMDGVEAAEVIGRRFGLPVIYLTAYMDSTTLERAKITVPYGYILKPFEERELHTTIEMALFHHTMERRVKESEHWLSTVLNSIGDAVIATDAGGRVSFMNPLAERIIGLSGKEYIDKDVWSYPWYVWVSW